MIRAPRPAAGLLLAALAAACSVAGPETQVKGALARLGAVALRAPGGAEIALERVSFADVAVAMDGPGALVVAVVEADGRARAGASEPSVAYVGREAFAMERCAGRGWCPADGAFASLRGVVAALAAAPRPQGARVLAWQIRVERDTASAGEDYEVPGGEARSLRAWWTLARDGDAWRMAAR